MTYIIRHSERLDFFDQEVWYRTERFRSNSKDPPITRRGVTIALDATLKIINSITNMKEYQYIYSSPFSRCIDTSIIIANTINLKTGYNVKIRVDYALREMSPIPLQTLLDDRMKMTGIMIKYAQHHQLFDTAYKPRASFDDTKKSSLNPMTEVYRPLDTIENINLNDKKSIVCTHGLNLASMLVKFPSERITQISETDQKRGKSLSSYCYTLCIN
jgi:broad specificity phosphatase PhoE